MPNSSTIVNWPPNADPNTDNHRIYHYANGQEIPGNLPGASLPAAAIVQGQQRLSKAALRQLFDSARLFINLPAEFYQAYLMVQNSAKPMEFPTMGQNKNISVRSCIRDHPSFTLKEGILNPRHWKKLGWRSRRAYEAWLDSSMLFAFSHCNHYCSAFRLIDVDKERNKAEKRASFHFKQYSAQELADNPKVTHIFSVTGFEYRGFREGNGVTIASTIGDVRHHSMLTMKQILRAAEATQSTDIVLIPFGMGVFLQGRRAEPEIRAAIMAGLGDALKSYKGSPVALHCCGWPEFYSELAAANNPRISFIDGTGQDAYTLANYIQDQGDEEKELETIAAAFSEQYDPRQRKSMLINAGDNDWTALLDNTKAPGQCSLGHTLYHKTSDEYFALITNFALYSIQNLLAVFNNLFTSKKIIQLSNLENRRPFLDQDDKKSSLSPDQLGEIDKLITKLDKEYYSCWPYPNKDRKLEKILGLDLLVESARTMSIEKSIEAAIKEYPNMLEGSLSTRTADLIAELRDSKDRDLQIT